LFRAGRQYDLKVNPFRLAPRKTADLWCEAAPEMIAEIKIIGADYYAKMRYAIESDVERMQDATDRSMERYMILIVPRSNVRSALGDYLRTCSFSPTSIDRDFPGFRLRIWKF
jgi:hypothetical protein